MSVINRSALSRPNKNAIADMAKAITESTQQQSNQNEKDDRFWHPEVDSAGNGFAIVRFLPGKEEDANPFVKTYDHGFQNGTAWYIEKCPTTLANGTPCPACEANSKLWGTGLESDKELVRKRKRRMKFVTNVLIIKDPAHPENEGQIKLFRSGIKIFEKIQACFKPDADLGEEAFDPFSFFDGANFAIKIVTVGGFINYDKSKFVRVPDLHDGDEVKLTEVLDNMHSLKEFNDPTKFKSYDELSARLNKVLYGVVGEKSKTTVADEDDIPFSQASATEKFETTTSTSSTPAKVAEASAEEDDLAFFQNLVKG